MADNLPLLVFPKVNKTEAPKRPGFPGKKLHFPSHEKQIQRLSSKFENLKQKFQAIISDTMDGFEPEMVLVIEIIGSVNKFRQAIEKVGLEWFGEWEADDMEPDEYFYEYKKDKEDEKLDKLIPKKLFVSLVNKKGLKSLLSLWKQWNKDKSQIQFGQKKWSEVFEKTYDIRQWGIKDSLIDSGMLEHWKDLDKIDSQQSVYFQIELFYRKLKEKRKNIEEKITQLLKKIGGKKLNSIDIPEISFHAIKVQLPYKEIQKVLNAVKKDKLDIQLFKFQGIMYFYPTGQSITHPIIDTSFNNEEHFSKDYSIISEPVAAILDGVPYIKHEALDKRLTFDDPDQLSETYQPGEKRHGTFMASLVIHGELTGTHNSLSSSVYHRPIMETKPETRGFKSPYALEGFPDEVFFEDRVERAVKRIFEGEGSTKAQAPTVKIINLSIGDPFRPFIHTMSPFAKLLDYLSYKYKVLFCVSAGNFLENIELNLSSKEFNELPDDKKTSCLLKCIANQVSKRRILSPAESINSLTIGALHSDKSQDYYLGQRIDLQPNNHLFSPISRLGHGFRRSIKPEIYLPGGRRLYKCLVPSKKSYSISKGLQAPGQKVAVDSKQPGGTSQTIYTHGTSNATALATHSGVKIYEMLSQLQKEGGQIKDDFMSVLIKTLLVHGATHNNSAKEALSEALQISKKEQIARYMGYGSIDINRVLSCTEQRGTIIGYGEIEGKQMHEYKIPLPQSLSGKKMGRKMLVTLAWFSPINSGHRNLREAKLQMKPSEEWSNTPLSLKRTHSDHNQVSRGTIQHEVLEKNKQKIDSYQENTEITLQVICKPDATDKLDEKIFYGLAVTLEVEENINIYQEIQSKIKSKQPVPIPT